MTVYFAKAGNAVKIGFTKDVQKRLPFLQCGSPFQIEIVRLVEGGAELASRAKQSRRGSSKRSFRDGARPT